MFYFILQGTPSKHLSKVEHSEGIFSNTIGDIDFFDRDVVRQHKEYCKKYEMERKCDCRRAQKSHKNSLVQTEEFKPSSRGNSGHNGNGNTLEPIDPMMRSKSVSELARVSSDCSSKENESVFGYHLHEKHHCNKTNEKVFCPKHEKGHRLYYSTENLSGEKKVSDKQKHNSTQKNKTQRMCQQENVSYLKEMAKDEYKTAFKAGIPNSNSSGTCTSFDSGIDCSSNSNSAPCIKAALKIPKPRNPFAKKNYSISTLNPPFSCFKGGAGQGGYPEHWRLASVYQHAYKPVENRKRPLLQTVFQ